MSKRTKCILKVDISEGTPRDGRWVPSRTGNGTKYVVDPNPSHPHCTCPDHRDRGVKCKPCPQAVDAVRGVAADVGPGQRPLSAVRPGSGVGQGPSDRVAVPAGLLSEPEPDRAAVEVREEEVPLLSVGTTRISPGSRRRLRNAWRGSKASTKRRSSRC
jgi:hypothetical protein